MSSLIGLTGFAGAGKDLVASHLKMKGYTRFAFADAVREEASLSLENHQATLPHFPDHILNDWLACVVEPEGVLWRKPMLPPARRLLQWWGTEYRRAQNPLYWIIELGRSLPTTPSVISDVRFMNEAEQIRNVWDGVIWRVERPGCKSDGHVSETELLQIESDYVIHNDGDLQHLATQVLRGLEL